jgi:hypothetical protein
MEKKKSKIQWTEKTTALTSILGLIIMVAVQIFTIFKLDSIIIMNTKTNIYQVVDSWFNSASNNFDKFKENAVDLSPDKDKQREVIFLIKTLTNKFLCFNLIVESSGLNKDDLINLYNGMVENFLVELKRLYYEATNFYKPIIDNLKPEIDNIKFYYKCETDVYTN